jgi:hypothetical protein
VFEELERICKEAAGSLWMCCTAIRFEGLWENYEKSLGPSVSTRNRTQHPLNTSRKPDDMSHLTWYASSPSKFLQACHCVNEASSVWGTPSFDECHTLLVRGLGVLILYWHFLRRMLQTDHGAGVGQWVTWFITPQVSS